MAARLADELLEIHQDLTLFQTKQSEKGKARLLRAFARLEEDLDRGGISRNGKING